MPVSTKQATKPVTPPCSDGTRAHRLVIEGVDGQLRGHCVREGCTWGRDYSNTLTETQWNTKTKPEEYA